MGRLTIDCRVEMTQVFIDGFRLGSRKCLKPLQMYNSKCTTAWQGIPLEKYGFRWRKNNLVVFKTSTILFAIQVLPDL